MKMENAYPENDVQLRVSAMCFLDDDLYVTVFTPDRTNKAPFKEGEIFRVTGLVDKTEPIRAEKLMGDLYEPTAIATLNGKIYIGEKDKISRLEDKNGDGVFTEDEKIVLIDGLSQPNFHTYTVGFDLLEREEKTYLAGNLTTSIQLGGSRDFNITVNPKTHRGSTFTLGPVTGMEKPEDVDISYIAGGYRTPNGFGLTQDSNAIVVDNQGVFNPSNEFIRIEQGGFYGHYLLKREDANVAAFQPEDVDSEVGGSKHQLPPTVHMPQGSVARSPAQPIELTGLEGDLAVYNGQFLVPDVTLGRMTRVFTEKVGDVWQGAVFIHSQGYDEMGENGFTAGPNRIVKASDGAFYIGGIGHGGLWRILDAPGEPYQGLQRLSFRKQDERPASFNEIVAMRDTAEGFELEFFKPLSEAPTVENFTVSQWTYVPTNGYGGTNFGEEKLIPKSVTHSEDGRKVKISIDGLRDNSPPFITKGAYSNENVGWVVNLRTTGLNLWAHEAWYTLNHHLGETASIPPKDTVQFTGKNWKQYSEALYASVCSACHAIDGQQLVGPNFKGISGRKQKVHDKEKGLIQITVDDAYLLNAIINPLSEYPEGFVPAMPDPGISKREARAVVKWLNTLK